MGLVLAGSATAAIPPEATAGLDWLRTQVTPDGTLSAETASIATALQLRTEALQTLAEQNAAEPTLRDRVAADAEDSTESLARRLIALQSAGSSPSDLIPMLRTRQNADGGFGEATGAISNSLDTAWALLAFKAGGFADTTVISSALGALTSSQMADGGFATPSDISRVYVTSYGLLALAAHRSAYQLTTPISKAQTWLRSQRNGTGSFEDVMHNALGALALARSSPDVSNYAGALDQLKRTQSANGSWAGDPFLTALAVRALVGVTEPPPGATTGTIVGQVVDAETRAFIPGAAITLSTFNATSDASGNFALGPLPAGNYAASISKNGYAVAQVNVTVATGGTSDLGVVALHPAPNSAFLRGLVTEADTGNALTGVTISVVVGSNSPVTAVTQSDGSYLITGLPAGTANIRASAVGFQTSTGTAQFTAGAVYVFSPALYAQGQAQPTNASLIGTVVDSRTGIAISGARAQVGAQSATTGSDGLFRITEIPTGSVSGTLSADGYVSASFSGILVAGENQLGTVRLAAEAGATSLVLSGVVTDRASSQPLAGATVTVQGSLINDTTDTQGRYSLEAITETNFQVIVEATGYIGQTFVLNANGFGQYTANFQLDRNNVAGIELDLATNLGAYDPYGEVEIVAHARNVSTSTANLLFSITILNVAREPLADLRVLKLPLGQAQLQVPEPLAAGATIELATEWYNLDAPAGDYTVLMRATDPSGRVVAEASAAFSLNAKAAIGGGIELDPPIAQAGSGLPVSLKAFVANQGNIDVPPTHGELQVVLETPDTSVSAQAPASLTVLAQGSPLNAPRGLISDASGNLYFASSSSADRKVLKRTADGQLLLLATMPVGTTAVDLTLDASGHPWILSSNGSLLQLMDDGSLVPLATGMSTVRSVVSEASGSFLVTGLNGVDTVLARIERSGARTILASNGLSQPVDAVADGDGLLVSNFGDNTISRVAANGSITPVYSGLNRPQGLARDASGNLIIAESGLNRISKIDSAGTLTPIATGIPSPQYLDLDAANNVLVTSGNSVLKVSPSGAVDVFAQGAANSPRAIEYDASGSLFVVNTGSNSLTRINPDGTVDTLSASLSSPQDLERGPDGSVYLAQRGSQVVSKIAGNTLSTFAAGFNTPQGITFDDVGTLYVAENGLNRISRMIGAVRETVAENFIALPIRVLTASGGDRLIINNVSVGLIETGARGRVLSTLSGGATSAAMTSDGTLYVLASNRHIDRIDADGLRTRVHSFPSSTLLHIAGGAPGEIFYADTSRAIGRMDLATGSTQNIAVLATTINGFVRHTDGSFFAGIGSGQIQHITEAGVISNFAKPGTAVGSLAVDAAGRLYAEINNNRIDRITADGIATTLITGLSGVINGIDVAPDGTIFVAESSGSQIRSYSESGTLIDIIAGYNSINDIEFAWDSVYFTDAGFGRTYQLGSDGNARVFATTTATTLEFDGTQLLYGTTSGVRAFNRQGVSTPVYSANLVNSVGGLGTRDGGGFAFTNTNNHRVVELDAAHGISRSFAGLLTPQGIAVAPDGSVYVANQGANNIIKLRADGRQSEVFAASISSPRGLRIGGSGELYAASATQLSRVSVTGVVTQLATTAGASMRGVAILGADTFGVDNAGYLRRLVAGQLPIFAAGIGQAQSVRVSADGAAIIAGGSNGAVIRLRAGALETLTSGLQNPMRLDISANGRLLVATANQIYRIDADGSTQSFGFDRLLSGSSIGGIASLGGDDFALVSTSDHTLFQASPPRAIPLPQAGTVVYSTTAAIPALALGQGPIEIDFGQFVPEFGGDYVVKISAQTGGIGGQLVNQLHVGPHATGTLTADRSVVAPGTALLTIQAGVLGADFTTISKIDTSNLRRAASSTRPTAMGADPFGNILFTESTKVNRIAPDGIVTQIYSGNLRSFGTVPVDRNGDAYIVTTGNALLRLRPDGSTVLVRQFPTATPVISHVMDSQERIVAWLSNSQIVRLEADGSQTLIAQLQGGTEYAMTIDGRDNLYLMDRTNTVYRVDPNGRASVFLAEPTFEYEGMPLAGDCADNLLAAPFSWARVNQGGEEHTLTQVIGRSGQVATVLNGFTVQPQLSDMDHLVYDRYGGRLLIWTDVSGSPIYAIPVTCGAISVDLHVVFPAGQPVSGFNVPPTATMALEDGASELIWNLKDVTNLGRDIRFDTNFTGLAIGDTRKIAKDAFLVFKNSFATNDIRLPIRIPEIRVEGLIDIGISTDRVSYPAQTAVLSEITVNNPSDQSISGRVVAQIVAADGAVVATILDEPTTLAPSAQTTLRPAFDTGTYFAGDYAIAAQFVDDSANLHAETSTPFAIFATAGGGETAPAIISSISTDKTHYGPLGSVQMLGRIRSQSANVIHENLVGTVTVTGPSGTVAFTAFGNIQQLLPNAFEDRRFTQLLQDAAHGRYSVSLVVTDAFGRVLSTSSTAFDVVDDPLQSLSGSVSLAATSIAQGEPQTCTDTLANLSVSPANSVKLRRTLARLDQETEITSQQTTVDLAGNGSASLPRSYETGTLQPGDYTCALEVDVDGQWRGLGHALFKVTAEALRAAVSVSTARPLFDVTDQVLIAAEALSLMQNSVLSGTTLRVQVDSPAGVQVFAQEQPLADFAPGARQTAPFIYSYSDAAEGSYPVHAEIRSHTGAVLDAADTQFEVRKSLSTALSGEVTVAEARVPRGQTQTCTDKLLNSSRFPLAAVQARQRLLSAAGAQIESTTYTMNLAANSSDLRLRSIATAPLALGDYACVLDAHIDGVWQQLDVAAFTVDAPAIDIDASLALGDKGRLLVLIDDPLQSIDAPPAPNGITQQMALNRILDALSWSRTVDTNAVDFATHLRSGDYDVYALLSERIKLDNDTQRQVREASYRGEGLIEAGSHDQRNGVIDDALGIKSIGKHSHVAGIELADSALSPGGGYTNLLQMEQNLRAESKGATRAGTFSGASPDLALSTFVYGLGKSVYAGFDLLVEGAAQGDTGAYAQLFGRALQHVAPPLNTLYTGRVVPISLHLSNQGRATDLHIVLPLPSTVSIADAGGAEVDQGQLLWTLSLAADETRTLQVWVRMPMTASSLTLVASVQARLNGDVAYAEHTRAELPLEVLAKPGLTAARSLAASDKAFKHVQLWLDKAAASMAAGRPAAALSELTKASDEIVKVTHPKAHELRLALDEALRTAGRTQ